jgi:hypothetical protein
MDLDNHRVCEGWNADGTYKYAKEWDANLGFTFIIIKKIS